MTLALVVQPDGHASLVETETDLDSIKDLIGGGWLEAVASDLGVWVAYADEEGRLKGFEPNGGASLLCQRLGSPTDLLVGPVVFFGLYPGPSEEDGYMEGHVPPELVEIANQYVQLPA